VLAASNSQVLVGMAEIHVLKGQGVFSCLGLGSCIGLAGYDPVNKVGGMVHVMLPEVFPDRPNDKPGKFADSGVPLLLSMLEKAGAVKSRMKWAMGGGAQVFKFGDATVNRLDIGNRNTIAVLAQVQKLGLKVIAQDTGGNNGRTITFDVETGLVRVRTVTQGERELCRL